MANVNAAEIDRILEIAPAKTLEIDGYTHIDKDKHVRLFEPPLLKTLPVSTLTGFVDLCEAGLEGFDPKSVMVHVASHERVYLASKLYDKYGRRLAYFSARAPKTGARVHFQRLSPTRDVRDWAAGALCAGPGRRSGRAGGDGGKSRTQQRDQAGRRRIHPGGKGEGGRGLREGEGVEAARVKLTPFRTFAEAVQPTSEYVFRVRGGENGNTCALFEADGGFWKQEAIGNVKTWLGNQLKGSTVAGLADIPVIA